MLANASYWDNSYHMEHFPLSQILLETLSGKCKELCLLRRRWMRGLGQGWFQDSEECQLCRRAAGRGGRIDLRAPEQVLPSWPWPCCACPGAWRGGRQPPPLPMHTRSGNSRSHCLYHFTHNAPFALFSVSQSIPTFPHQATEGWNGRIFPLLQVLTCSEF